MKILIVGSGGREHAIAWKLSRNPKVEEIYCAPGNAGIAEIAQCLPVKAEDIDGICTIAREKKVDLTVIGPEVPLAMGIVDSLENIGVRAFGPDKNCAQLEASKAFTKQFLDKHNIPTAGYKEFNDKETLLESVGMYGYPMVLKADGLAAGKGVVIAETKDEAEKAIEEMMGDRVFGTAGDKVVVEEYLQGVEASVLCFVDEHTIIPMASAQDYKRIYDGDKGPNTGGMGTYSPSLLFTPELEEQINKEILLPTLKGFQQDGLKFKGVLFVGIMLTKDGPKVIEFNNRFGDPETQSILTRLSTDLLDIFEAVVDNRLSEMTIEWRPERAVTVVLASGGYPGEYDKGIEIKGLENFTKDPNNHEKAEEDIIIFHAGTKFYDGYGVDDSEKVIVTNGGRVLNVTALGETHEEAREKAFAAIKKIHFEGMQYRNDIGLVKEI